MWSTKRVDGVKFAETLRDGTASSSALERIARLATRLTGAPFALASLVGEVEHCVLGADGAPDGMGTGSRFPRRMSLCRIVVETELPLIIEDARNDRRVDTHPGVAEAGVQAYLGMPLRDGSGVPVGALCAISFEPRAWADHEIEAMLDLADCASTQLSFAAAARDREAARAELERSTAFQNAVLEGLSDAVIACDATGRVAYTNTALRDVYDLPDGPLPLAGGPSPIRLFDPDDHRELEPSERPLARAFGGATIVDQHVLLRDERGVDRHFLASGGPVRAGDTGLGATVALREITDEVRGRRLRAAQLSIATALADGSEDTDVVGVVLTTLNDLLHATAIEYMEISETYRPRSEVVAAAIARNQRAELTRPDGVREIAVPIVVGDGVAALLHLEGGDDLADEQTAAVLDDVGLLVGRWRAQQRIGRLRHDLAETRRVLESVVAQVNDWVFSIEVLPDGVLRPRFHTSSQGVFGGPMPEGMDWTAFFGDRMDDDGRAEIDTLRTDIRAGRASSVLCRIRGFDDVERWVLTRTMPRREDGRLFVDGIGMDVTDRQRVAEEREALLEDRRQQVQQLQALDRAKDEFVATVAHEIRGPLGLLVTFADEVAQGLAAPERRAGVQRMADLVLANAEHLQRVVEDIFDIARLDAGAALRTQELDPSALLEDLGAQYAVRAEERRISIDVSGTAGVTLSADASRLRQALENLVSNAVKYSREGGKVRLRCELDEPGGEVLFVVTDDGIGIPAEDLPQLFTRFYRASNARESETPGTGLGLCVSQAVTRAHGGELDVVSATEGPNRGTTFTLRLPH